MKKMYDEGDDDMKRTIAKVRWDFGSGLKRIYYKNLDLDMLFQKAELNAM